MIIHPQDVFSVSSQMTTYTIMKGLTSYSGTTFFDGSDTGTTSAFSLRCHFLFFPPPPGCHLVLLILSLSLSSFSYSLFILSLSLSLSSSHAVLLPLSSFSLSLSLSGRRTGSPDQPSGPEKSDNKNPSEERSTKMTMKIGDHPASCQALMRRGCGDVDGAGAATIARIPWCRTRSLLLVGFLR